MSCLVFGARRIYDSMLSRIANSIPGGKFINYKNEMPRDKTTEWIDFDYHKWILETRTPIMVQGILRGANLLIDAAERNKIPWYRLDNGYFGAASGDTTNGCFRIIKQGEHLTEMFDVSDTEHPLVEYRERGESVLFCPISTWQSASLYKMDINTVNNFMYEKLKSSTKRNIIVRTKQSSTTLEKDLENSWCVVSFQSTVSIKALCRGIPVLSSIHSCAAPVSFTDYKQIDSAQPVEKSQINKWVRSLELCNFNQQQLKDGTAYKLLKEYQDLI